MKIHYPLTHAYVHWLADPDRSGQAVHSGSFAPALALSFHDSKCSRNPPMPIASVVSGNFRKNANMAKRIKFKNKAVQIEKKKKGINTHYIILTGLIIISISYHHFVNTLILGYDYRYFMFVLTFPTITGIALLGFYKRKYLKEIINTTKAKFSKVIILLILVTQGFLFSFFSIGLVCRIIWDYSNIKIAEHSSVETINCKIFHISSGSLRTKPSITFIFQGTYGSLDIDYKTQSEFSKTNIKNLEVQLETRKGIWNSYIVDNWCIIEKNNSDKTKNYR